MPRPAAVRDREHAAVIPAARASSRWPRASSASSTPRLEALFGGDDTRAALARLERARHVLAVHGRRIDRGLEVATPWAARRGRRARSTGPAGRRPACRTRASGRRRAARATARASCAGVCPARARSGARIEHAIWSRVPSGKPSSGITGEVMIQPPVGVATTTLPRVDGHDCVVSRRPCDAASAPARPATRHHSLRAASRPAAARVRAAARATPFRRRSSARSRIPAREQVSSGTSAKRGSP